jgi:hypothetical protein
MSKTTIPTGGITADAIDATLIADDAISEEHLDNTALTGFGELSSLADADKFLVSDASDSNNIKYVQKSNLPSGDLVKLTQANSLTDASVVNIDSIFTNVYTAYRFCGTFKSTNSDVDIRFRWRASSSDLSVSQYYGAARGGYINGSGAGAQSFSDWAQSAVRVAKSLNNNNYNALHFDMLLYPYNNGGVANIGSIDNASTAIFHTSYWHDAAAERHEQVSGGFSYTQTTVPDGFAVYPSAGDWDGYKYAIFGYKG